MLSNFLPNALQYLLTAWLIPSESPRIPLQFELRHEHALSNTSRIVFSDVKPTLDFRPNIYSINTSPIAVHRRRDMDSMPSLRPRNDQVFWDSVDIPGPDVQNREVLLMLAKMANNAYTEPGQKDWYDIGSQWNNVSDISWLPS